MSQRTVERYLALFDELTQHPYGITREELRRVIPEYAETYSHGAFVRKFERDKAALRAMGLIETVNPQATQDQEYAYRAPRPDRPAQLTSAGSLGQSVTYALVSSAWGEGDLAQTVQTALTKIGWSVTPAGESSTAVREGWFEPPHLATILQALAEQRVLTFVYENVVTGELSERHVVVGAVGRRFDRWYLWGKELSAASAVGENPQRGKFFRLDRMSAVWCEQPSSRDASLDVSLLDVDELFDGIQRSRPETVVVRDAATEQSREIESYSVPETATLAILEGAVVEPSMDGDGKYQNRVRLTYLAMLERLIEAHRHTVEVPDLTWTRVADQRQRRTADTELLHHLALARYATENPGVTMKELGRAFGQGATKTRRQLDLLHVTLGEENFDYREDEQGVHVRTGAHVHQAVKLSAVETVVLLLTMQLISSVAGAEVTSVQQTMAQLAMSSPQAHDLLKRLSADVTTSTIEDLQDAMESSSSVKVEYLGAHGTTRRTLYPLRLLTELGVSYVQAQDDASGEQRYFRLDRLRVIARENPVQPQDVEARPSTQTPADWVREQAAEVAVVRWSESHELFTDRSLPTFSAIAIEYASQDGYRYSRIPLSNEEWLKFRVLAERGWVELVSPQHLREDIARDCEKLIRAS
ncbi:WYL domain-containing protein [Rothia sp. LK2588]|uniref:transcriptional regulator n=1 Tax=Rothia sp. LK2588 TaxID=3114369 RepID=UPI0034CD5F03